MDEVVARLLAALPDDRVRQNAEPRGRSAEISPSERSGSACLVDTTRAAIAARSSDRSGLAGEAGARVVVRPRTTAEVARVMRIADETRTPVVPQGRLTGLAGGANAIAGAILLDVSGMDRILRVDREELAAVVQPGVIVADLQKAAREHGLFYAPDPASARIASIGGTVATNAGGMRAVKYGVTRDWVRSLEVVTADGSVVRTRPQTVKAVAGYDLTGLVVGSEGTLAVVTEATVRLIPAPAAPTGIAATFRDVPAALGAVAGIITGGALPATIELLDEASIRAIRRYAADGDDPEARFAAEALPEGAGAWIVVATDTPTAAADLRRYEHACRENGAQT
ncbi:MAG TPA: FAD-binding protein, partial [Microbacteriaceae bacterium]|nr:FAD-binding protein [Microbacteriaceae bacterium]